MVKQHYGNDLGLSYDEMESFQTAAETVTATQPRLTTPTLYVQLYVRLCILGEQPV